jgi:hypothetical protein
VAVACVEGRPRTFALPSSRRSTRWHDVGRVAGHPVRSRRALAGELSPHGCRLRTATRVRTSAARLAAPPPSTDRRRRRPSVHRWPPLSTPTAIRDLSGGGASLVGAAACGGLHLAPPEGEAQGSGRVGLGWCEQDVEQAATSARVNAMWVSWHGSAVSAGLLRAAMTAATVTARGRCRHGCRQHRQNEQPERSPTVGKPSSLALQLTVAVADPRTRTMCSPVALRYWSTTATADRTSSPPPRARVRSRMRIWRAVDGLGAGVNFFDQETVDGLVEGAQGAEPRVVGNNYVRVVNAGRPVGVDRTTGLPTDL